MAEVLSGVEVVRSPDDHTVLFRGFDSSQLTAHGLRWRLRIQLIERLVETGGYNFSDDRKRRLKFARDARRSR